MKIFGGGPITFDVKSTDTILSVKQQIQREVNVPVNKQRLTYNGETLEDDTTIAQYAIKPLTNIIMEYHSN